jgi:hypothetical protein
LSKDPKEVDAGMWSLFLPLKLLLQTPDHHGVTQGSSLRGDTGPCLACSQLPSWPLPLCSRVPLAPRTTSSVQQPTPLWEEPKEDEIRTELQDSALCPATWRSPAHLQHSLRGLWGPCTCGCPPDCPHPSPPVHLANEDLQPDMAPELPGPQEEMPGTCGGSRSPK